MRMIIAEMLFYCFQKPSPSFRELRFPVLSRLIGRSYVIVLAHRLYLSFPIQPVMTKGKQLPKLRGRQLRDPRFAAAHNLLA